MLFQVALWLAKRERSNILKHNKYNTALTGKTKPSTSEALPHFLPTWAWRSSNPQPVNPSLAIKKTFKGKQKWAKRETVIPDSTFVHQLTSKRFFPPY